MGFEAMPQNVRTNMYSMMNSLNKEQQSRAKLFFNAVSSKTGPCVLYFVGLCQVFVVFCVWFIAHVCVPSC